MAVYVITLEPDSILRKKILKIKKGAKMLVGRQHYLTDEPHLTLYVGKFKHISLFDKGLKLLVKGTKKLSNPITIKGWTVFKKDILTKRSTLVCGIGKKDTANLRKTQKKIIYFMQDYQQKGLIKRYQKIYSILKGDEKKSIKKYGFPFVGRIWKPHLTIASFDKQSFDIIWKRFKNSCPKGTYGVVSLNVYALNERVGNIKLAKRYRF